MPGWPTGMRQLFGQLSREAAYYPRLPAPRVTILSAVVDSLGGIDPLRALARFVPNGSVVALPDIPDVRASWRLGKIRKHFLIHARRDEQPYKIRR
jgi:hypothetical protein